MSFLTHEELLTFCKPKEHKAQEFTDEQLSRLDDIQQSAAEFMSALAETDDAVWDLDDIWYLIYEGSDRLTKRGRRVRIPTHVTEKSGKEYITDWYGEEEQDADLDHRRSGRYS